MKKNIFFCILFLLILIKVYFSITFLQLFSKIDTNSKNITTLGKTSLVVPKIATIGDQIIVEIYHSPQFTDKLNLRSIMLVDSSRAYEIETPLRFTSQGNKDHFFLYSLGQLPFYKKFEYTIPSKVCPQQIVYTTCKQVATKRGNAYIELYFDPEFTDIFDGEGYQGDGEFIKVPIIIR